MPQQTILPFPNPQQNLAWGWPNISTVPNTLLQPMNLFGYQTSGVGSSIAMWGSQFVTGNNQMIMHNGVLSANFNNTTTREIVPYPYIIDDNANIGTGCAVASQYRYMRIVLWLTQDGVCDETCMFACSPAAASAVSYAQAGQPSFGFMADGSGGWLFVQSAIGAFPGNLTESIAIGGIVTGDFNAFEFEFFGATTSSQASAAMSVNGTLIASRSWTGGASVNLPATTLVANGNKQLLGCRAADASAQLVVGPMFVEQGRFTKAGLELTGL